MDNKIALEFLRANMLKDPDFAFVWYANINMMIFDAGVEAKTASKAADNIMSLCFNIDMNKVREVLKVAQ